MKTTMISISAVPLKPGDLLVVHSQRKLDENTKRILHNDLTKQLWGKPNKFIIVEGDFKVAAVTPPPEQPKEETKHEGP